MPTFTLRLTKEEQEYLHAMAQWKHVSMSDLAREYLREGVLRDATAVNVQEQIQETIRQERQRLEQLGVMIQKAAAAADQEDAATVDQDEALQPESGPRRGG